MKRTSSQPMDLPQVRAAGGLLPWFLVVVSLLNTVLLVTLLLRDPHPEGASASLAERGQQETVLSTSAEPDVQQSEMQAESPPVEVAESTPPPSRQEQQQPQERAQNEGQPEQADDEMMGRLETVVEPAVVNASFQPRQVRLQVLNGTDVSQLAAKSGDQLQRQGYDVREVGNARYKPVAVSYIVRRQGSEQMARWLARQLGVRAESIRSMPDPDLPDVDLSLVLGADHERLELEGQ